MATTYNTLSPTILRLKIERFRGIESLVWYPKRGVNVIIGGDVGKTTILDAIALLLNPTNTAVLSDADCWHREVENGLCIETVMSLPERCAINQQTKNAWLWEWDGKEPKLPLIDEDSSVASVDKPVYRLRVRGSRSSMESLRGCSLMTPRIIFRLRFATGSALFA